MVTVVIVPLVALMKDMLQNIETRHKDQIGCSEWKPSSKDFILAECLGGKCQVIFVQVENAVCIDFMTLLSHLQESAQLARIVVDEAHCLKLWSLFRPALKKVLALRAQVEVPFVFLTAT